MDKVKKIVKNIAENQKCELVDFDIQNRSNRKFVKIITDIPSGGISLDQISKLTSLINNNDEFNACFAKEDFRLEVSSPGLDYPLRTTRDFKRNLTRKIRIFHNAVDIDSPVVGKLETVHDNEIEIIGNFGKTKIFIKDIDYAKIEIEF